MFSPPRLGSWVGNWAGEKTWAGHLALIEVTR